MNEFDLIGFDELLKIFGISKAAYYRLKDKGEFLKEIRIGKKIFFHREDVKRWITEKRDAPRGINQ